MMYHLNIGPQTAAQAQYSNSIYELQAVVEARGLCERAYGKGRWNKMWSLLTRHSRNLLDLARLQVTHKVSSSHYIGLQTISIRQIRGSESRSRDFDKDFYPLKAHDQERWRGVAAAYLMGKALPAVEVIQIEDTYFVQDGHHRISVARMLGQQDIEATVTVWQLNKPLAATASSRKSLGQSLFGLLTKTGTIVKSQQILAKLQLF